MSGGAPPTDHAAADPAASPGSPPGAVLLAAAGAAFEAATLVVAALAWVVLLVTRGSTVLGVALFLIIFALGLGVGLAAAAMALRRGSRKARGPIITWQLLQTATAIAVLGVPGRPGVVTVGALAAAVGACVVAGALLTPRAVAFATR